MSARLRTDAGSLAIRYLEKRYNVADESDQEAEVSEPTPEKVTRKRSQVPLEVRERKLAPKPSLWPIILAGTLVFTFIGIVTHPVIFVIGVILIIAAIIGWMLEKH
jgi:hypothetical protein